MKELVLLNRKEQKRLMVLNQVEGGNMTRASIQEYTEEVRKRYLKAKKKEKDLP